MKTRLWGAVVVCAVVGCGGGKEGGGTTTGGRASCWRKANGSSPGTLGATGVGGSRPGAGSAARRPASATPGGAGVLRQQRGLSEAAFRGGQFGIADVIRVRVLATEAEIAQGRADIAVRQARSRVNQALGLLP